MHDVKGRKETRRIPSSRNLKPPLALWSFNAPDCRGKLAQPSVAQLELAMVVGQRDEILVGSSVQELR